MSMRRRDGMQRTYLCISLYALGLGSGKFVSGRIDSDREKFAYGAVTV